MNIQEGFKMNKDEFIEFQKGIQNSIKEKKFEIEKLKRINRLSYEDFLYSDIDIENLISERDIEYEVNERLKFKLSEIITSLSNQMKWSDINSKQYIFTDELVAIKEIRFSDEAKRVLGILRKEVLMDVPSDTMFYNKKNKIVDEAIEKIYNRLKNEYRGKGDEKLHFHINFFISLIDDIINRTLK